VLIESKLKTNTVFVRSRYKIMPVRKVQGGYQWGTSGKVYPTRAKAEAQSRAAYANGYRENKKK
jgi:hypothetical protein